VERTYGQSAGFGAADDRCGGREVADESCAADGGCSENLDSVSSIPAEGEYCAYSLSGTSGCYFHSCHGCGASSRSRHQTAASIPNTLSTSLQLVVHQAAR
jgi:hypothetical protein